ncbi:MAG: MotA/TolQ/ExbB proton channel family protein [Spirochaetes bacterium]|jgi:biopolymer transport protein ExbB|nr:MotA/TolQ/ExbB proton channel family protein [Spirochaetota bacterium]
MAEKSFLYHLISASGFTVVFLLFCSIATLGIIIERYIYFHFNAKEDPSSFIAHIKVLLKKTDPKKAIGFCENGRSTLARVAKEGLDHISLPESHIKNSMERRIAIEIKTMEKYTNILGTIGSTSVYIGLFGTVIGIIHAFSDLSSSGAGGGINIVIGGIAEALVSTAAGIFVAVPAVFAYNLIMKRIDNATIDMELCSSELIDLINRLK